MYGTGVAAQAAAYHAAGVPLRRLATAFGYGTDELSPLVLGFFLQEALQQQPTLELVGDPGVCRLGGCGAPPLYLHLCGRHVAKFYKGRPLLGGARTGWRRRRVVIDRCVVCGIAWCRLTAARRSTCRDPRCLGRLRGASHLRRDAAIMEAIQAGRLYREIAEEFGVSRARIGQMARAAGIRRYRPRTGG